jgi:hypothetical protein
MSAAQCQHSPGRCADCGVCRTCCHACNCEAFGDIRDRSCPGHTWEQDDTGRTCSLCGFFVPLLAGWDPDAELRSLIGGMR